MSIEPDWKILNPGGAVRIVVTKELPGTGWLDILLSAGYRVDIWCGNGNLREEDLEASLKSGCAGVIGQLTEKWDEGKFRLLKQAGGSAYSNYAVGYDNVDLEGATRAGIGVGNTPGVLTETTAEMAMALTMACARRITEADRFTREGSFSGWLPGLFLGKRLWKSTLGIIGAGRIGTAYARMVVRAFQMNLVYLDNKQNKLLEEELDFFSEALVKSGYERISVTRARSLPEVLVCSNVVSLHVPMNSSNRHMISSGELKIMKRDAILINTSRGPVVKEADLAAHLADIAEFRAGLDVYEFEPEVNDLLKKLPNVVLAPHIASATRWTRENMAKLAALNIRGIIEGYPAWGRADIDPFLGAVPPAAIPSFLNPQVSGKSGRE
jgi:hydroxypyruvate reductase 1